MKLDLNNLFQFLINVEVMGLLPSDQGGSVMQSGGGIGLNNYELVWLDDTLRKVVCFKHTELNQCEKLELHVLQKSVSWTYTVY